jgi:hypothetical protein
MTRAVWMILGAATALAGCAASRIDDTRAQTLLSYSTPEYYAERRVARELAAACPRYGFDARLDQDMEKSRAAQGRGSADAAAQPGAVDLETNVKKRSLSASYGASFGALDPCDVLDRETARGAPFTVFAVAGG